MMVGKIRKGIHYIYNVTIQKTTCFLSRDFFDYDY